MSLLDRAELHQLVLVATAWRDWKPDDDAWRDFDRLLRALLGRAGGNTGRAWIAMTEDGAADAGDWVGGTDAQKTVETFTGWLRGAAEPGRARESAKKIIGHRLRVLCDPDRAEAVFADAGPAQWSALDVQFLGNGEKKYQIHLGFSFWAIRPPWLPPDGHSELRPIGLADVPALRDRFKKRASIAVENLVNEYLGPTTTLMEGREYAPPMFWVATLARHDKNLRKSVTHPAIAKGLVRPLLGRGPTDSGMAASIINGNVLALRHFRQEHAMPAENGGSPKDHDAEWAEDQMAIRPVYLLLLREQPPDSTGGPKDREFQQVVRSLTEFEARAATDMHDIDVDLEVWRTHVRVYDDVAAQAGALWDAVALHLPVRKGSSLAKPHRAIALVHQTLLQGVADLADLVSQVDALTSRVDGLSDELTDLVDERLSEEPLSPAYGTVGARVAQASQLSRLRRLSGRIVTDAQRVKGQYEDLLTSIAHAFDERRVRELDVLQRSSYFLSVAVGGVTIVTVLDFLFNVKRSSPLKWPWWLLPTALAILLGLLVCAGVVVSVLRVRKAQTIGSHAFRERYEEALGYLRDSSTRELDRHPLPTDRADDSRLRDWRARDRALATRFAALWDTATSGEPPARGARRKPTDDIEQLSGEIEQWTLRALLLSERPRRLSSYRLPRLTLLYRHCVNLDRARRWDVSAAVVANIDLEGTFEREGYSRVETWAIDHRVTELVREERPTTTAELLGKIERVLVSPSIGDLDRLHREFVRQTVKRLTDEGIHQFIDVGSGIPGTDTIHALAGDQARVLYVDIASNTVVQGEALLPESGRTQFIEADMRRPAVLWDIATRGLIDPREPVAVLFTRILGYHDDGEAFTVVDGFRALLPAGSYIVISHAASGRRGTGALRQIPSNSKKPWPERLRSRATILRFFQHLELLPPGLIDAADPSKEMTGEPPNIHIACGIGRIPWP